MEATSAVEASDSARSLCSAQHIVRTNAIAKTVGVIEKGGSAERALVEKRQGDASASDSARSQEVHSTQSDPLLGQRLRVQDKRAASLRGPKTVEVTRAVEASEGAQSLGSAQRTVRPAVKGRDCC